MVGVLYLAYQVSRGYKIGAHAREFKGIDDQGAQVTGYLATYLLPFITPTTPSGRDYLAYGVFFLSVFLIFVRSDMALINPTLYALGYSVYRARWVTLDNEEKSVLILSRERPPPAEFESADLGGIFVARRNSVTV